MALGGETVGTAYVRLHILGTGLDREIRREIKKATPEVVKGGDEHGHVYGDAFTESFFDHFNERMDEMFADRSDTTRRARRFSDTLGRIFGKGARNDFLNFTGSFVGGIAKMGEALADLPGTIAGVGSKLRGLGTLIRGGGGVGAGGLEGGLAGLLVAIFLFTESLGVLGSGISGLTGIVTAFASTLAFALAGGLTAAAGAAFYFGSGLGVVALAIANLSQQQKKALAPITTAFKGLGKVAAESFGPALVRNVDGIVAALERLEPIVRTLGRAMGHVLDDLVDSLNGPAWRQFLHTFRTAAPNIIDNLGRAFTAAGEIFAGVMRAATPLVQTFAGWLAGAAHEVSNWVNSAKGQNRLTDFFAKAGDAAAVVGDVIGELTESLFLLFDAGNKSGQNMLGGIADALDRFNTWMKSKEGQKALADWFAFAEQLAGKLGDIFVAVIDFLDDMDTPRHRKELLELLGVVERVIRAVDKVIVGLDKFVHFKLKRPDWYPTAGDLVAPFSRAFNEIQRRFAGLDLGKMWDKFIEGPRRAVAAVKHWFTGLAGRISNWIGNVDWSKIFTTPWPLVNRFVSGLARRIGDAMGKVDWSKVFKDPWATIRGLVSGLARRIGDAMGNVNWSSVFGDPWDAIRSKITGLGSRIADAIGTIHISADIDWPDPPSWLSRITPGVAAGGIFAAPTRALIGEAGPEAVVPLRRPLSMVDPAVRELSAFAQGLTAPTTGKRGNRPNQTNNFYVTTPTSDPRAVASEVMNRLVTVGY